MAKYGVREQPGLPVIAIAAAVHVALGLGVAWFVRMCCGPDIENADRGVELLAVPTWSVAAFVIWWKRNQGLALAVPPAWALAMFVVFAVGVYRVAYNP